MAPTYTCTACSRALSRAYSKSAQRFQQQRQRTTGSPFRKTTQQHNFSSTVPTLYQASQSHAAASVPNKAVETPPQKKPHGSIRTGVTGLAQKLREKAPLMTETYVAYGATRDLVKECIKPGEYKIPQVLEKGGEIPVDANGVHIGVGEGWWYDTLGLTPNFSSWAQITFIHMYMLQVRFRMFPKTHAPVWIQHLTNHAFYAAEDRLVVWHKFNANSLRQKYLKDMFSQWRAALLSYDEGFVKGDAMLAAAVWRNLLSGREDVDFEKLAQIVAYIRKELQRLDQATDDEVANGGWKFDHNPGEDLQIVQRRSAMMLDESRKAIVDKKV